MEEMRKEMEESTKAVTDLKTELKSTQSKLQSKMSEMSAITKEASDLLKEFEILKKEESKDYSEELQLVKEELKEKDKKICELQKRIEETEGNAKETENVLWKTSIRAEIDDAEKLTQSFEIRKLKEDLEEKQRAIEKAQISEEKKNKLYEKARKQTDDGLNKLKLFKAQSEKISTDAKADARDFIKKHSADIDGEDFKCPKSKLKDQEAMDLLEGAVRAAKKRKKDWDKNSNFEIKLKLNVGASREFPGWSVSDLQASVGVENENKEATPFLENQELEISSSEDWDDIGMKWSGTSWVEKEMLKDDWD